MTFDDYQKLSRATAIYPNKGNDFVYPVLGLLGEAGELADKVKKVLRDQDGKLDEATKNELAQELGDTLWYAAQFASELKLSLEQVAEENIEKTQSRLTRGKLHGSGDDR
jgi:NTP pyrophosphatase (non-canonical NTP hydrolase)